MAMSQADMSTINQRVSTILGEPISITLGTVDADIILALVQYIEAAKANANSLTGVNPTAPIVETDATATT